MDDESFLSGISSDIFRDDQAVESPRSSQQRNEDELNPAQEILLAHLNSYFNRGPNTSLGQAIEDWEDRQERPQWERQAEQDRHYELAMLTGGCDSGGEFYFDSDGHAYPYRV